MADFIVLRLKPENAVDAASFTQYLTGLTIRVYDVSFGAPKAGNPGDPTAQVGLAEYKAPTFGPFPVPPNPTVVGYPANTSIVQHFDPVVMPFLGVVGSVELHSVATAVIPYPAVSPEYPSGAPAPDLRLQFERAGQVIYDTTVYYDVPLYSAGGAPAPEAYSAIPEGGVSAYVTLPAALGPSVAQLQLPEDGTPANYDALLDAVNKVLAADPGPGSTLAALVAASGPLTVEQCRNIAYEILWGPGFELPPPSADLEPMYTNPPNTGEVTNTNEQDRMQFEGTLRSFYAPRAAKAERLTNYVFAISAATWGQLQSQSADKAIIQFPVNPGAATTLATIRKAEVIVTGALGIDLPAQYFYVLGARLPAQVTAAQRYRMACGADQSENLTALTNAVDEGIISDPPSAPQPAVNPAQAARMLAALAVPGASSATECPVTAIQMGAPPGLWTDWLAFPVSANWRDYQPGDDDAELWLPEVGKPAPITADFLELVLYALTQGYIDSASSVPLAEEIRTTLTFTSGGAPTNIASVADLTQVTGGDWRTFFAPPPTNAVQVNLLPPFTQPGTPEARVEAFIRHVQKFFDLTSAINAVTGAPANAPPTLQLPVMFDSIESFAVSYGGFTFGTALVDATVTAAVQAVFPGDPAAQAWLEQTIRALNDLCQLASVPTGVNPLAPSLEFSIAEALYARGFTSVSDVLATSLADFQGALRGTIAFDQAAAIYAKAQTLGSSPGSPASPTGSFRPINPGMLTNCIPPCHFSPLGPVEYLHELLKLSETSTCDDAFAAPESNHSTLGDAVGERRGSLGTLAVSKANLETPLPKIDIVNECLEYVGATMNLHGVTYNTSESTLADHKLCPERCCHESTKEETHACHDPATLFAALPEYASPATPGAANAAIEPLVFNKLKHDFSSCCLPYSQALDVSRVYLKHFCTSRFETMRSFRKCITELALDPQNQPGDFREHLWRYPVRIDIAIEYLCITPEEYLELFGGVWPRRCGEGNGQETPSGDGDAVDAWKLYGFDGGWPDERLWTEVATQLPEFLKRTCLSYCELLELADSGFVPFAKGSTGQGGGFSELPNYTDAYPSSYRRPLGGEFGLVPPTTADSEFPKCEPCCLEEQSLEFPEGVNPGEALYKLAVFIRLWRKLKGDCGKGYSFNELADICNVLQLFVGGAINPDFIRQLAAFQMLRDEFRLALVDKDDTQPGTGADRSHLLALWVGPGAQKWHWAVDQLLEGVERHAKSRHKCDPRGAEFLKLLADNLGPLSALANFDPNPGTNTWYARPTHTLRFAEVLAKIYASQFGPGEILFLFQAEENLRGDDPFPFQEEEEALDDPLAAPEDTPAMDLWELRRKLLEIDAESVTDEEAQSWTWPRIVASLKDEFGYKPPAGVDPLTSLVEHYFPNVLQSVGVTVSPSQQQYRVPLITPSPLMWDTPPDGPFHYDSVNGELWTQLPLRDEAVIEKLDHMRQLDTPELQAVQDLYFLPRVDLAPFTFLFSDRISADRELIQEPDESARWDYFQRRFAITHARCRTIAAHLASHVASWTDHGREGDSAVAWLILRHLFADENKAKTPWEEDDSGQVPDVTWELMPNGGAFAALLGLTGTGLLGEFTLVTPEASWHREVPLSDVSWRDVRGPMHAFGDERNRTNCPVPTVLPPMDLALTPDQLRFVALRNGLAIQDEDGTPLGGAKGFTVRWSGVLLVEQEGSYDFCAGAHTPEGEEPDFEAAEHRHWRVTISRGQKSWLALNHGWPNEEEIRRSSLSLKRGAYRLAISFTQPDPEFSRPEGVCPQRTGFELKYCGPDSGNNFAALPLHRLYREKKDDTLAAGIDVLRDAPAKQLLELHSTGTLRDIRRTYQRAFKAMLFAHRFALTATPAPHYGQSELGYMLGQADRFSGASYFRTPPNAFAKHEADFDFNLLPVRDAYQPPTPAQDQRVQPSAKRTQALFDWWERIFDYTRMRRARGAAIERPVWLLFLEATEEQPDNPVHLLRHMDVDFRHAELVLHYFQNQTSPVYKVTCQDLEDERWAIRAWHGDRWIRRLLRHFCAGSGRGLSDIRQARPDLWGSDDPSAPVDGEAETGNANLSRFLCDGYFENGEPRRYEDAKRLNDCLRERARDALLAFLCTPAKVPLPWGGNAQAPKDLSDLLLIDVEAGICEKVSRIEEAITAVQSFIRRARLGVEPKWVVSGEFARLWDRRFATFKIWEACKCRELYRENWIEWGELRKAKEVEAFRFLESELRRSTLTVAVAGGLEYWRDQLPPAHPALKLLQQREPSTLARLNPAREGLGVLGTPERDARPSWLAPIAEEHGPATENVSPTADLNRAAGTSGPSGNLPFWMEAAIRLGVRFFRIAAGGVPPASARFETRYFHDEPECCAECGYIHPPLVDEYYFWLVDARFYKAESQSDSPSFLGSEQDDYYDPINQTSAPWHDETQLPNLLDWKSSPMVRLAWCRVHNGEFKQPRRSVEGVRVDPQPPPDLDFLGRVADSLVFAVTNALPPGPPGAYKGSDAPGFRYDLASDEAVVLPLIEDPPPSASTYPSGLPAYPYFVYVEPGGPLFPTTLYSPALAVACALRAHCRYEAALKWYEVVWNPLRQDNTWMDCSLETPDTVLIAERDSNSELQCCDSTLVSDEVVRQRSIVFHYLETLSHWADALIRLNTSEAFQQARVILDAAARILGPKPASVMVTAPTVPQTVENFTPLFPPLNPKLLELYGRMEDRLGLLHHCLNAYRHRNGSPRLDMPYWGEEPCRDCPPVESCTIQYAQPCVEDEEWCHLVSPYRFLFLVEKAQEMAGMVRDFGNALLAAFEKGDAEYLASLRASHEVELLTLTRAIRQDQWREADWQRQSLLKTKEIAQTNRRYYAKLIQNGLNSDEHLYEDLTQVSLATRAAANVMEGVAEAMDLIPDLFVGFPCNQTWVPLGTKLSGMFKTIARITNNVAEIEGITASLDLTRGGWDRREEDWVHQVEVLDIEIQQIERQVLAAERRRDQALRELNQQQRQIEASKEVQNFLRDKFTSHELYLWLQKETAALHYKAFELALHTARQAQRAFNFERGLSSRQFLPREGWDNLHEGLLAGERLQLALRTMEKAYLDLNTREYELTKHISLRQQFPLQFLQLKTTGYCEVEIPEWMFDLDYPGQYMRRIKNVTVTIPCVTGPFTGVNCRLTLLSSSTRVDPRLTCPPDRCCDECKCENAYEACPHDPRVVRIYAAREAIATSSGQNDAGMFEISFRDERYLPFEFLGAVSRWRIELPPENNCFDMDTLSDFVLNINFTSKEGGSMLRRAASEVAQCQVRNRWTLFDIQHEFPEAWRQFQGFCAGPESEPTLVLRLIRSMFPYVPCDRELLVTRVALMFETDKSRKRVCCEGEYKCCDEHGAGRKPYHCKGQHTNHCEAYSCRDCEASCCCKCIHGCYDIGFTLHKGHGHAEHNCECDKVEVRCFGSAEWPTLYHGVVETRIGPLDEGGRSAPTTFEFPASARDVTRAFLLCQFEVQPVCTERGRGKAQEKAWRHGRETRTPGSQGRGGP